MLDFSFTFFFVFFNSEIMPSRSKRSVSGVKEKCIRGQGGVDRASKRSVSGSKEKCIEGQGKVLPLSVWYSAEALLLDP